MTPATEIVAEIHSRGLRVEMRPKGGVRLVPARLMDPVLLRRILAHKAEVLARLRAERQEAEINRLARADGWKPLPPAGHPAYSVLDKCRHHGVALRIDPETGDLVVGRAGATADEPTQPWPTVLMELEAHLEDVAALVASGWTLTTDFPKQTAA
jgi:hypothetical protein